MSDSKKGEKNTKLENWYYKNREDYLKDYLQKTEARNKYILLGAGGGILSIFKFLDLFKNNKYIQGFSFFIIGALLILGIITLFTYIYGAKSSYTFISLLDDAYAKKLNNPKYKIKKLEKSNKDFKLFMRFEKMIIWILSIAGILSIITCALVIYSVVNQEDVNFMETNKKNKVSIESSNINKKREDVILPNKGLDTGLEDVNQPTREKSFPPTVFLDNLEDEDTDTNEIKTK